MTDQHIPPWLYALLPPLPRWARPRLGKLYQHPPRPVRLLPMPQIDPYSLPSIGIATANYNQGHFLPHTLQSVLGQGYPYLQYAVQDAGSQDDSMAVLAGYRPQLSYLGSAPDTGPAQGLNRAFAALANSAQPSTIMAWINSDDLLLAGSLAYVGAYFAANPHIEVVYSHRILVDSAGGEVGRWVLPPHRDGILAWADYVPQETLFWRRSLWDRVGGSLDESYRFAFDWELLTRFVAAGATFARLPCFLGAFRVHSAQKTSTELATLGATEMTRLRTALHGHPPSEKAIYRRVRPYLIWHMLYDLPYRWRGL
jgi:GT2 family glycosyltransferase